MFEMYTTQFVSRACGRCTRVKKVLFYKKDLNKGSFRLFFGRNSFFIAFVLFFFFCLDR